MGKSSLSISFLTLFYFFLVFSVGLMCVLSKKQALMAPATANPEYITIGNQEGRFTSASTGDSIVVKRANTLTTPNTVLKISVGKNYGVAR